MAIDQDTGLDQNTVLDQNTGPLSVGQLAARAGVRTDTIRYYEQLATDNGGQQQTAQWSRLFLVPGMGHCGGGPATLDQFDMLEAVVGWVEKGAAPASSKSKT